ncbi:MAG: Na/Pi cotransporter family protein [Clostridiales bacterium]|nr:Na/Pi cotransporter family protein [Clostridiales bacterium]
MGISIILSLLCGVALFLFGMSLMGDSLKKVAGNKMENILYKLTNTPVKGILLGAVVTAIIQSSGATTVMIVGFVNSGMMKVAQAIGIIMGANIGTSITGWILCLSYIDGSSGIASILSTATIPAIIAIVGIVIKMASKKSAYRSVADIMLGFAILMTGMQMMSGSVAPLKENDLFVNMITMFSNPVLGIIGGILLTVVLQSASASVGVIQALSATGNISFAVALPVIMGIGIGASCPVLLSAIGTNKNGKRTALIYLLNDTFGMLIWSIIFYSANALVHFKFLDMVMSPVSVAFLNTAFRMATMFSLLPFMKLMEKLVFGLIKDTEEDKENQADFSLLEERFLNYPILAITQTQTVMNDVAKRSRKAVYRALGLLKEFDDVIFNKVKVTEALVDKYEDRLCTYLMKLTVRKLTPAEKQKVSKLLYTISDFESLSDYAVNIGFIASELNERKIEFSAKARFQLSILAEATKEIVDLVVDGFVENDFGKIKKVEPLREVIDIMCDDIKEQHIDRLREGVCVLADGTPFNDILSFVERISAHCSNIAVAVNKLETQAFDSSDKPKAARELRNAEYLNSFKYYDKKYDIDVPMPV